MRYVLLALTLAACSRSQAPAPAADAQQEVAPLAEDVTAVDVADAPSAVTP